MKRRPEALIIAVALLLSGGIFHMKAQGVADPLGIYGLDRFVTPDVRTRGMGWAGTAAAEHAGALFTNPALLTTVNSLELQVGGSYRGTRYDQRQEWYPDKPYATLSLLFEDRLDGILDTNSLQTRPLERAYDDIGPNWEKERTATRPASIVAAYPIEVAGLRFVAAAGYGEAINLDHYFQNNNALSPYIGAFQPAPIPRPAPFETVKVAWYQHFVERTGSVYGITPGLAVGISDQLSVGLAATILSGTSDDTEGRVERGLLNLTTSPSGNFNYYSIDSLYSKVTATGTSTYSGVLPTLGVTYRTSYVALGVSYRLPATITRSWDRTTVTDTTGALRTVSTSGEDKVELPSNMSIGLAIYPHDRWKLGIDYVINNLSDAVHTPAADTGRNPWLSGKFFRIGAEVRVMDGLYLRGGFREDMLAYGATGSAISGDPVRGSSYSLGVGIQVWVATLDLSYERSTVEYHDTWTSNINYNGRTEDVFSAELSIAL